MNEKISIKHGNFPRFDAKKQQWSFVLEKKIRSEISYIYISIDKHKTVTMTEGVTPFRAKEVKFLKEKIKSEHAYKKVMSDIESYEKKASEMLKIKDLKILGKIEDKIAVSFEFASPVIEEGTFRLVNGLPDVDSLNMFSKMEVFFLLLKRDNRGVFTYDKTDGLRRATFYDKLSAANFTVDSYKIKSSVKMNGDFFTHSSFLEDITELILKDKGVRMRIITL